MEPQELAIWLKLLAADEVCVFATVPYAIEILQVSTDYKATLQLIENNNRKWLERDDELLENQNTCITDQAKLIDDQKQMIESLFAVVDEYSKRFPEGYEMPQSEGGLGGLLSKDFIVDKYKKLILSHQDLWRALIVQRDLWREERDRANHLHFEKEAQRSRVRLEKITKEQKEIFIKLVATAPRFKESKEINFRAFERQLQQKMPNGIGGRRFLGDGKLATDAYEQLKS